VNVLSRIELSDPLCRTNALRQAGVVQIARQAEARIEGIREW